MRRDELRIQKLELPLAQALYKMNKRDLRSVPHLAEHRLAEECTPERDAVQTAGKLASAIEYFDAVRPPQLV